MDFRTKYIAEYLDVLKENYSKLTDWERKFYESVKNLRADLFKQHQFNKLKEIAEELKGK